MTDEHRDPELESVWAEWEAPTPSRDFHGRVLNAFNDQFGRTPWWRTRWMAAAAVVTVGVAMAAIALRPIRATHYEPVPQPHFMIVSAGEHP